MCVSNVGGASVSGAIPTSVQYGLTISPAVVISEVVARPVTLDLGREAMSFLFVRVTADDGTIGCGEACDSYGCSYASVVAAVVDDVFAPLLVGQAFGAVEPLVDRLRLATRRRLGATWIAAHA